jgi:hypothetical protein
MVVIVHHNYLVRTLSAFSPFFPPLNDFTTNIHHLMRLV